MELIFNSNDPLKTFFELWGCKESYIKAIGVGLSFELNKIDFLNINDQVRKC
jgi:4'-phosphopantetheinyl transferase